MKQKRLFNEPCYCIDTSSLVNLTRYPGYPRDIFPAIWKRLEEMVKRDELISHIEVYKEIGDTSDKNDTLYQWCKQNRKIFRDYDDPQMQELNEIKKKYDDRYWQNQINKIDASGKRSPWADPWLIALGICEEAIIITDEKNNPNRIPHIANCFQIQCINLLELFKRIGIKY